MFESGETEGRRDRGQEWWSRGVVEWWSGGVMEHSNFRDLRIRVRLLRSLWTVFRFELGTPEG
jgi:hypothetical protein